MKNEIIKKIKNNWQTKKVCEIIVGVIFIVFAVSLFLKEKYVYATLLIALLVPLFKLDSLSEFGFSLTEGIKTKFRLPKTESKTLSKSKNELVDNVAVVSCKIASQLPNTVEFNLLRDRKVWFWVANNDSRKYKVYIKIKFMFDGVENELKDGYYGGTQAWKLDAFTGIQAPGLEISKDIVKAVLEGKRLKIQINCAVKDEEDNLIENKFPQTYVYDRETNSWFLEP